MLDVNSLTGLLILILPLVADLLKRFFPLQSDNAIKITVGLLSVISAVIINLYQSPVINWTDLLLRIGVIYSLSQVVYDKLWASTQLSKALSGQK